LVTIRCCSASGGSGRTKFQRVTAFTFGCAEPVTQASNCFQYSGHSRNIFIYSGEFFDDKITLIRYDAKTDTSSTFLIKNVFQTVPHVLAIKISLILSFIFSKSLSDIEQNGTVGRFTWLFCISVILSIFTPVFMDSAEAVYQ
jgi:hypothetical protein